MCEKLDFSPKVRDEGFYRVYDANNMQEPEVAFWVEHGNGSGEWLFTGRERGEGPDGIFTIGERIDFPADLFAQTCKQVDQWNAARRASQKGSERR
jgi:hypothetical protein